MIPSAALFPILLFIGLVIGAQAFQTSVARHAPAIVLALVPNIAQWAKTLRRQRARPPPARTPATVGCDALTATASLYQGMAILGAGAVLAGLMLGAIAVFVIDKQYAGRSSTALVAAVLAAVGLIHDPAGLIFQFSGRVQRSRTQRGLDRLPARPRS